MLIGSRRALLAAGPEVPAALQVGGCRCYLDADSLLPLLADGAAVSRWPDLSGHGNDAVSVAGAFGFAHTNPTFDADSALGAAVLFNGAGSNANGLITPIGSYMQGSDVPYTMIFVLRVLSADTGLIGFVGFDASAAGIELERSTTGGTIRYVRWSDGSTSAGGNSASNLPTTTNVVYTLRFGLTANTAELFDRGTLEDSLLANAASLSAMTNFWLGGYDTYAVNMAVAKFAFYDRALTDAERQFIERDLGARHGIAVA